MSIQIGLTSEGNIGFTAIIIIIKYLIKRFKAQPDTV